MLCDGIRHRRLLSARSVPSGGSCIRAGVEDSLHEHARASHDDLEQTQMARGIRRVLKALLKSGDLKMTTTTERAILAGGCFWGMQQLMRRLPGIVSTRVGYSGGRLRNATY